MKQELVRNWMTTAVISIPPGTSIPQADKLMIERGIRRLPVVDENGRLLGIITHGDAREARPSSATSLNIWEVNYLIAQLTIDQIMTTDPITITADETIGNAALLMSQQKISGLPVIGADRKLVGIITESDIFRLVVQTWHSSEEV